MFPGVKIYAEARLMLKELVIKNRSCRKFDESFRPDYETLFSLADTARFTPSTVNRQAVRLMIINDEERCETVFDSLSFAGLLKGAGTPKDGEKPTAYIILLCDLTVAKEMHYDEGIIAQTILLAAVEKGLGGCMLGSINREKLFEELGIDRERYTIDLVIALGKPAQETVIDDISIGESTAYYRDARGVHHVPKIRTEDLLL